MPPSYTNPNYKLQVQGLEAPITSATISQQPAISLPPQPPVNNGIDTNLSIPTPQQIIDKTSKPTDAETQQSSLSSELAKLIGEQPSLATRQTEAQTAAGLPGMAKTITELNSKLQGLSDQATKLQLDAAPGGTIENQNQLNAEGRGITAGGLAPIIAADLRRNQIQQAAIASQSLTTKSAVYAAMGQYSLAKEAADKAAQVLFDADEQKIKYRQAQLAALQPILDREEKKRSALQSALLAERTLQLGYHREDFKTGQGLAILAMKNNPNDQRALFAAQQALQLDPSDPQYLAKVLSLVGNYQQDPIAIRQAAAELEQTRAQTAAALAAIKLTEANTEKVKKETIYPGAKPSTGEEKTTLGFFNRAKDALATVQSVEGKVTETLAKQGQLQFFPNLFQTADQQIYRQAQRQFTEARLRKESGAAIPNSEYENDAKTYFAQPGDGKETLARKQEARLQVLNSLGVSSGNAFAEYYGQAYPTPARQTVEQLATSRAFDLKAARAAGYTEEEIRAYLQTK